MRLTSQRRRIEGLLCSLGLVAGYFHVGRLTQKQKDQRTVYSPPLFIRSRGTKRWKLFFSLHQPVYLIPCRKEEGRHMECSEKCLPGGDRVFVPGQTVVCE